MISVIVPVYNAEKTLNQCVDSILSQKYKDFELLLINDGSKDRSGEICNEYALKDNRVRVFHQENKGVSAARNVGLDNILGEFATFCDSDDWVEDTWLSDYIDNYNGEDVLFQNARWWKDGGIMLDRKISLDLELSTYERIKHLYLYNTLFYIWSAIWKSSIIKEYNLKFENVKLWEDRIWTCSFCTNIKNINIIPINKQTKYNYNYRFPFEREYEIINKEKFKTIIMNLDSIEDLCHSFHKESDFPFFSKIITSVLLQNLFLAYRNKILDKEERQIILKTLINEKKRLYIDTNSARIHKIIYYFITMHKNSRIIDIIYRIIFYL